MTEEKILQGLPKIIENAQALLSDADFLFDNQRFERAYSIYQLSIEEIAKAFHLINVIIFDDLLLADVQNSIRKVFKDHKFKSRKSVGMQYLLISYFKDINLDTYERLVHENFKEYESIEISNEKKNHGFYASLINNLIAQPSELIKIDEVKRIRTIASLRVKYFADLITAEIQVFEKIKTKMSNLDFASEVKRLSSEHINELEEIRKKHQTK
jgi:AbiV family abortive infection protein